MITDAKQIKLNAIPTVTAAAIAAGDTIDVALAKHELRINNNTNSINSTAQDNQALLIYKVSNFGTL